MSTYPPYTPLYQVPVRKATISLSLSLTCTSQYKPWESLSGLLATTPLVDFHHRLTACPSYQETVCSATRQTAHKPPPSFTVSPKLRKRTNEILKNILRKSSLKNTDSFSEPTPHSTWDCFALTKENCIFAKIRKASAYLPRRLQECGIRFSSRLHMRARSRSEGCRWPNSRRQDKYFCPFRSGVRGCSRHS